MAVISFLPDFLSLLQDTDTKVSWMHQFTAWCKTRVCQPRFIQTLHWYFVIPSPPKYSIFKSFMPKKRLWETKINMLWSFIIRLRKHLKTLFLKHFVRSECGTAYWRWGRASKRGTGDRELPELDLRQIGWDTFRAFPNLILHSNLPLKRSPHIFHK